ncbi:hypothetical protein RB594_003652 [Gaeumannomyces avenae]
MGAPRKSTVNTPPRTRFHLVPSSHSRYHTSPHTRNRIICKVVFGNVGRGLAALDGLLEFAREKGVDVVCVNEPALLNNKPRRHPGWACVAKEGPKFKAIIYVGKNVADWTVERKPQYHSVSVCFGGTAVSTSYWHPNHDKYIKARDWCATLNPNKKKRILVGDFNAKHPNWDAKARWTNRGQELVNLSETLGFYTLNANMGPTHRRGNTLDIAFGPAEAYARTSYWVSDHRALIITLQNTTAKKTKTALFLPVTEEAEAKRELSQALGEAPKTATSTEQLENQAWHVQNAINGVMSVFGQRSPAKPKAKWWKPELAILRDNNPTEFQRQCRKTRRDYYKSALASAGPNNLGPFYKWKTGTQDDRPTELRVGGRRLIKQNDIAAAMANSAFPKATSTQPRCRWWDTAKVADHLAEKVCQPPTSQEVKQAYLIRTSTTPGPDGVTVSTLKAWWSPRLEKHLTAICQGAIRLGCFPQAWKQASVVTFSKPGRDHKTTSGWRPITLLLVLGKGLERLMQRRMAAVAVLGNVVSRDTAGALPLRSAQDLVASLVFDTDKARQEGKHGFLATFDVKSAFPSVSRAALGEALATQGWRPETVALAQSFVTNRKYKFKWHDEGFRASDGLPQGSPWSPVLLTLVLATVTRPPSWGATYTYMDDIAQFTTDPDPETAAQRATRMAWRLNKDLRKLGLRVDPNKTELLYLPPGGKGARGKAIPPNIRSLHLPTGRTTASKQITWLGVTLKAGAIGGLSLPANVTNRLAKAQALTALTTRINIVSRGLRPDAARTWFKSAVVPTLTYGLWPLFQGFQNKRAVAELSTLERATRPALKALVPAWRTSPTPLRYWTMGFSPQEVWGRELARASERLHTLPRSHPLMYRLRHSIGKPSRLSRLYTSTNPDPAPDLDPVAPKAPALADLLGTKQRPIKKPRPKGDPGPRLPQADPEPWWEANKPRSFEHVRWDPKCSWEKGLKDVTGRGQMHTILAEGSGHGNFGSYHTRFKHPPTPNWYCICGELKEVSHTDRCEIRRVPAPWRRAAPTAGPNPEEEWWRRGYNAVQRLQIEKALKELGVHELVHAGTEGMECKTREARPASPGEETEEELEVVVPCGVGTGEP